MQLIFLSFITNHFVYACMGMEGWREGMYQNVWLRIHRERGQKCQLSAYAKAPNQTRIKKKLATLVKFSYLN